MLFVRKGGERVTGRALFVAAMLISVMIYGACTTQAGPLYDYTLVYYFFNG